MTNFADHQTRLAKRGITIISEYHGTQQKARFRHICGHEWCVRADVVLYGSGCFKCRKRATPKLGPTLSESTLCKRYAALAQRGITPLSQYQGANHKMKFSCRCGYKWKARLGKVFSEQTGCKQCARSGFQSSKAAIVYYVRLGNFYKIGVTNRTVKERFESHRAKPEILEIWNFTHGSDAIDFEQRILNENAVDRYCGPDVLPNGNDELFVRDVLGLDLSKRAPIL